MKKITSILSAVLLLTLGVSSCMDDFDTPVTGNAYGNNTINEQRTITIANLKEKIQLDYFSQSVPDNY